MRDLRGKYQVVGRILMLGWAVFILATAWKAQHPLVQGSIFLFFALALAFMYFPLSRKYSPSGRPSIMDEAIIGVTTLAVAYVTVNAEEIMLNLASSTLWELILAGLLTAVIIEACRRTMGIVIPLMALIMIGYTLLGHYLPPPWGHAEFSITRMLEVLYLGTTGFWGQITSIMSTVIGIFVLFGAVLLATGAGEVLTKLATLAAGRMTGGGAKAALFASAAAGTIQGSSVSNVATTGAFTIPMMKSMGYRPEFAGASEAVSSTGGQIMPPIMGAGAFIMAEFLGIPYLSIAAAALMPAILYFSGAYFGIHFYSLRNGIGKMPKDKMPKTRDVVTLPNLVLVGVPIGTLLYFLLKFYTPQVAALFAIVATIIIFFSMIMLNQRDRGGWVTGIFTLENGIYEGCRTIIGLTCLMACVQIMVSLIGLTGVGLKLSQFIAALGEGNLALSLVLAAITTLILGMGIPTTAAYVLGVTVLGGALQKLGVDSFQAHMFIFYYSILSVITPPVCAAVYTAAGIARTHWWPIARIAVILALPAYLVPFLFITDPVILGQGGGGEIALALATGFVGTLVLASGAMGYLLKPAKIWERVVLMGGSILMLIPGWETDLVGVALALLVLLTQSLRGGGAPGSDRRSP